MRPLMCWSSRPHSYPYKFAIATGSHCLLRYLSLVATCYEGLYILVEYWSLYMSLVCWLTGYGGQSCSWQFVCRKKKRAEIGGFISIIFAMAARLQESFTILSSVLTIEET